MKKIICTTLFVIISITSVVAQEKMFEKEDIYISGTVGYGSSSQGNLISGNQFEFSPSLGHFIDDKIALEAILLIGITKSEVYGDEIRTSTTGGGLGATYYFTPATNFSFTTGLSFSFANYKTKYNNNEDSVVKAYAITIIPGINYFVSKRIALRASLGALSYASSKSDEDEADATNAFSINLELSDINIGLIYKF